MAVAIMDLPEALEECAKLFREKRGTEALDLLAKITQMVAESLIEAGMAEAWPPDPSKKKTDPRMN